MMIIPTACLIFNANLRLIAVFSFTILTVITSSAYGQSRDACPPIAFSRENMDRIERPDGILFRVVIAPPAGDETRVLARSIARSFENADGSLPEGLSILVLDDPLLIPTGLPRRDALQWANTCGRFWLNETLGDLLIWGETTAQSETVSLRFTASEDVARLSAGYLVPLPTGQRVYRLTSDSLTLPKAFSEDFSAAVAAVAITLLAPVWDTMDGVPVARGPVQVDVVDILLPLVQRFQRLVRSGERLQFVERNLLRYYYATVSRLIGYRRGDAYWFNEAIWAFGETIASTPRASAPIPWGLLQNELAITLWRAGEIQNDTDRLRDSLRIFRLALEELTRERVPLDWADAKTNLANVLLTLTFQTGDTRFLPEAVQAFEDGLEELTRERAPLNWAVVQNNYGVALWRLGELESDKPRLEKAVEAFKAALTIIKRDQFPIRWAQAHVNLAGVYLALNTLEGDASYLDEALTANRSALTVLTREAVPAQWAIAQSNLGVLLSRLGKVRNDVDLLREAIGAFRNALEVFTKEGAPLYWASIQNNIGATLTDLGIRSSGTAYFAQAIEALEAALQIRTRARSPYAWAETQDNLGKALTNFGAREQGTEKLAKAVDAFNNALQVRTRSTVPLLWATTQDNLGVALTIWAEREPGTDRFESAVAAFRRALTVFTKDRFPLMWGWIQGNMGQAYWSWGRKGTGTVQFEAAVKAFNAALEVYTRDQNPVRFTILQEILGWVQFETGWRFHQQGNTQTAIRYYDQSTTAFETTLSIIARTENPMKWGELKILMGRSLLFAGNLTGGIERLQRAERAILSALEVITAQNNPGLYNDAQNLLAAIRRLLEGRTRRSGWEIGQIEGEDPALAEQRQDAKAADLSVLAMRPALRSNPRIFNMPEFAHPHAVGVFINRWP